MGVAVIRLGKKAVENSAFIINIIWYDEAGVAMTPTSINWSCYDNNGSIVNSLSDVSVTTPATSNDIVLNGTDTAVISGSTNKRTVQVVASYNSATYGNNLLLYRDVEFDIDPLSI
jgi:hypothetical protein